MEVQTSEWGDEILNGAALYTQRAEESEARLTQLTQSLSSYKTLSQTLTTLHSKTRHAIMAPIANGLAYFDAEIFHTNDVMVLLGDNWFAERTVQQANEICDRRTDYLSQRKDAAAIEWKDATDKLTFFHNEYDSSQESSASKDPPGRAASSSSSSTQKCKSAVASKSNTANAQHDGVASNEDAHDIDDGELDFSPEDELTNDELDALEKSIAPELLHDDEYVEQLMLEAMLSKRQARLAAESVVFGGGDVNDEHDDEVMMNEDEHTSSSSIPNRRLTPAVEEHTGEPMFTSPADIGRTTSMTSLLQQGSSDVVSPAPLPAVINPTTVGTSAHHTSSTIAASTTTAKRVTFDPSTEATLPTSGGSLHDVWRGVGGSRSAYLNAATTTHSVAEVGGGWDASEFSGFVPAPSRMTPHTSTTSAAATTGVVHPTTTSNISSTAPQHTKAPTATSTTGDGATSTAAVFQPLGSVHERRTTGNHASSTNRTHTKPVAGGGGGRSLFMQRMLGERHQQE